uniref:Putative homing endonuclease n=1 Tax=viral metagenome TaxID=1070528 RepID=A0A6M3LW34_9ZZZZ
MEKSIGRFLDKKEVVHHIDEDPENNCIDNLKLYKSAGERCVKEHPEALYKATQACIGRPPWNKGVKDCYGPNTSEIMRNKRQKHNQSI